MFSTAFRKCIGPMSLHIGIYDSCSWVYARNGIQRCWIFPMYIQELLSVLNQSTIRGYILILHLNHMDGMHLTYMDGMIQTVQVKFKWLWNEGNEANFIPNWQMWCSVYQCVSTKKWIQSHYDVIYIFWLFLRISTLIIVKIEMVSFLAMLWKFSSSVTTILGHG